MKIAILGYAHPFGEDRYYGAERVIWYLIQELKRKGHECVVFSVGGCNLPGFEYIKIPIPWEDNKDLYLEAIRDYENKYGPFDYVHSYMASGYISQELRSNWPYSMELFFSFTRFPHNIIVPSKRLNRINGDNSTVIPYGLPKKLFSPVFEPENYAVWLGRGDMGKAPDIAMDVAERAGIRLILMGPAYHYPYFKDTIYPRIDNDKFIWLRSVDDEIKFKVMKKAKVYINPNWCSFHEMFGLTNIEALACGVPIIGWANSAEPSAINFEGGEIITSGVHGFINEFKDFSPEERERTVQCGVEFVKKIGSIDRNKCYALYLKKYTSEMMAEKHLKYFSIIKERGKVLNITDEVNHGIDS
jgi:glycosyltransferase involved in cell wall biosynthesis